MPRSDERAPAPSSFKFSSADVKRAAAQRKRRPGWYRWAVKDEERNVSTNGHLGLVLQTAPMTDPDDPSTAKAPYVRHQLTIPVKNPDHEGHEAPNTAGICQEFYLAIGSENVKRFPRKEGDSYMYDGEEISKEEIDEKREEASDLLLKQLQDDYESGDSLIGETFYGELYENKGFMNIRKLSAELPDGAELVAPEDFFEVTGSTANSKEEEEPEAAKPAKNGHTKKPAAKAKKR